MKKYVLFGAKTLFFSFLLMLVSVSGWGQCIVTWSSTAGTSGGQGCAGTPYVFTSSGQTVTSSIVSNPNTLTFQKKRSGNSTAWSLVVEISTNPAHTTFTTVTTISAISNTCGSESVDLSGYSGDRVIRLRDTRTTGGHERTISDISLTCGVSCSAPTVSLQSTPVDGITTTGATLYGDVTGVGGGTSVTQRGFQYSTSNTLASPTAANSGTGTGTYNVATGTLVPNTVYYYRAYAINNCATPQTGYSHTSGYPTFTSIHNAPNIETGTAPTSHGFTANWSAPSGTVGSANFTYEIQVSTDNTFATVDFTQANVASTSNSLVINDAALNSSTTYYYRVRANNDGGSSAWSAVSAGITTDVATFTSIKDGDWNTASTWNLNSVPGQNDRVVINHIVSTAIGITRSTSTTVNGTFQLNSGGYVNSGSTNFTYNQTTGTLNFKTNGIYGVNNNDAYWPVTDGPVNVNVLREATDASGSDSGFRLNSANRTIPENGTLSISGYNGSNYAGIFLDSSTLYINGKVSIKPFGFVANTPVYGNASTLEYNNVTSFTVGSEWTGNNTMAGAGVPQNVSLVNNANINMPTGNRGIAGNLTITSGSTVNLNNSNGDLYIAGNWNNAGTFNPNSRAVFLNGSTNQTITGATAFDYLFINNANNVTLASNISVNNNTNSKIDFINGKLILGANNLTLDGDATVTGANASRYIVTNGAGRLIRNVGNTEKEFPVGFTATNYTPVKITNTTGTSNIGVSVKQSITNPVNDPTRMVTLEWNVNSSAATTATIVPNWEAATPVNQGASFNNTGTGELGNYTTSWNIYHPLALATTTTTATGVALRNGVNLIAVGNENTILPASTDSEIVVKSGYVYPQNILYANYQATNIGTPDNSSDIEIAKFTIKDGKRGIITTDDADNLGTTLTSLSFSLSNSANVRRIAIYDDAGEEILEQLASSNHTFNFNTAQQLKLTAPDNGTKDFSIRVSFKNTVTDNQNLQISITGATALATGSGFFNAAAGGATTSVAGDNNRIEVVADRIAFGTQPQTTAVNTNLASFTLKFVDENNNLDFDTNRSVAIAPTDGSITDMSSTSPYSITAPHSGVVSISDVKFALPHTNITLTATTTGLLSTNTAVSNAFDIVEMIFPNNSYHTASSGTWTSTGTGTATWNQWTNSGWVYNVTKPNSSGDKNIFIHHNVTIPASNGSAGNYTVTVLDGATLTFNGSSNWTFKGLTIEEGSTLAANTTGVYMNSDYNFEIKNGGTFILNALYSNASNIWAGTEIFHPESNFIIKEWSANNTTSANRPFYKGTNISTNTYNGYTAAFGNLEIDLSGSSESNSFFLIATGVTSNLAHGNLYLKNPNNNDNNIGILGTGTATSGIGGTLTVDDLYAPTKLFVFANSGNLTFTVGGDMQLDGATTAFSTSTSNVVTVTVKGNLNITPSATFNVSHQSGTNTGAKTFNLEGDLYVAGSGLLRGETATRTAGVNFNFTKLGDGLTPETTQTIDIASTSSTENRYLDFYVKNGAYVQLINRNFELGTTSKLIVENGGTFDFGFSGSTALNVAGSGSMISQQFELKDGGTLKITSPDGITTTANLGNVQTPVAGRTYAANATYHYIGKADQVSGNGLPAAASGKTVIVEMDNDDLKFWATPEAGAGSVKRFNSDGKLEIRRGIVLDGQNPDNASENYGRFADAVDTGATNAQSGNLKMTGGRYILYTSNSYAMPHFSGDYDFTGGVIQFDGNDQSIRAPKSYLNVEVTGKNVGTPAGNITLLDNGNFIVKNGGEFLINSNSIVGSSGSETITIEDGGVFRTGDPDGFSGSAQTSIQPSVNNIILENGSTVEYSRAGDQLITVQTNVGQGAEGNYYNLKISGSGTKSPANNITVNNITNVENGATLTIPETADNVDPLVLTSKKGVQVEEEIPTPPTPAGQLILENNANLMQDDDAVNSGNIKVNRTMKPRWFGTSYPAKEYNFFSSPVEGQDMKKLYNNDPANTLFVLVLDEPANIFKNAKASDYLVKGKGFAVKEPKASYVNGQPDKTKITAQFTGKPNNGSSIASPYTWVSITNQNEGWNLIGNPYPSNLDLIELYKANNNFDDPDDPGNTISPTFKFWDNTVNATYTYDGVNYNQYSYAFFNAKTGLNGDGVEAPGLDDTNPTIPTTNAGSKEPARYVGVAQGFIVEAINSGGNISFNNTMRKAEITGDHFFGKAAADDDKFKLQLVTPQGVVLTQSIVYFDGGNNHFGIEDSKHPDLEVSELFYSFADEEKVLINGRESFNSSDVVPLGVKTYQQGNYKIRIKKLKGIFENGQAVYLKDKSTGMLANLTEGDYEFSQEAGEYTNRFEIVYKPEATLDVTGTNKDTVQVYRDGDDFVVKSSAKSIKEIELYDMSGKLFYKTNANSKEVRIPSYRLVNGIYILKAQLENSEVVNKKIRK